MTWFSDARTRRDVLAALPHYQDQFNALYAALWKLPQVPAATLELCRLRLAQLHDSDTEWRREEFPIAQAKREQLSQWHSDPQFTSAERACLDFAEIYAMDPQAISDEQAGAVKEHFGEAGLVALVEALGLFFGLTRLSLLWQLAPENHAAGASASGNSRNEDARPAGKPQDTGKPQDLGKPQNKRTDPAPGHAAARIQPRPPATGDVIRDSALGLVPEVLEAYIPLSRSVWLDGPVSPGLLEVARLRNARKVNCVFCKNARYDIAREDGLDERKVDDIRDGYEQSQLSHREKLLLAYTDQYLDDPAGLRDELRDALTAEFSAGELVHLSLAILLFNTFSRCAVSLGGMPEDMPVTEVSLPQAQ